MVFSSVIFLYTFLPLMLLFYYILPRKCGNFILMLFSLVFYSWGEPVYILLMLYSILMNYISGLQMDRHRKYAKEILVFAILMNLAILGFFKYAGFVLENVGALLHRDMPTLSLALPIGISFYTFQALSYIIDLYREKYPAQKNIVSFAAYITMFPQLIAGPIVRYEQIEKELKERTINLQRIGLGTGWFLMGLGKKVLIANQIGSLYDTVAAMGGQVSTGTAWLGAVAYTLQIYFDFSGYSDMAIGLGHMLGFTFCENFNHPYLAGSVTEFWRRWHISLSSWFREYVYIPLGGNRVKAWKHIRNILVVWLLTGLWHGASWNFVIWGLYYGLLLLWEKFIWSHVPCPKIIGRLFTILAIIIGWVIFTSSSVDAIVTTVKAMFGGAALGLWDGTATYYLMTYGRMFLLGIICCFPFAKPVVQLLRRHWFGRLVMIVIGVAILLLSTAYLVTQNYNPFLYFQF